MGGTVLRAIAATAVIASFQPLRSPAPAEPEVTVRLLPPGSRELTGRVLFEALLIEPEPWAVVFFVDGLEVERRKVPPWEAKVQLDSPAREQIVRVELQSKGGEVIGSDEIVVNRPVRPLRASIVALEAAGGQVDVRARVSTPDEVELDEVGVFLNDLEVAALEPGDLVGGELTAMLARSEPSPTDFVRVEARLRDGRTVEDVELIEAAGFAEELDVRLVQLQVLVTDSRGAPIRDLSRENFLVRNGGELEPPAGLFVADDVSLLLGLSLDSSGSMRSLWPATRAAASLFLRKTLTPRDQGFLIDFDTRLRLVRSTTDDVAQLVAALDELDPEGGTALYDSILFALLQFERQQGRRGLVVMTDGFDENSASDPKRVIELGKKLGVPIYILALEERASGVGIPGRGSPLGSAGAGQVHSLRLLTEPTGGRLYRVPTSEHMSRAFDQINAELRNQYVLTYYSDDPPSPGEPPQVRVEAPGKKGLRVRVVFGSDQIY